MIPASDALPELEKYELEDEIGHGGMASVYRARDRRLGREVAIKIIHKHLRQNSEVARRFTREARAIAKLRHPNIVEVFDVSHEAEVERYLVMELVKGPTLRQVLAREGALPVEVAGALALELARALEHAHAEGIIHRDVKPENVLLEQSSEDKASSESLKVKLTDFGIAKMLDAQGVTSTGQVLGSPAHMAPEQIEGGEVGAAADVFGLGVLLYEGMTGRLPFQGSNPAQVLRRVLEGDFMPAERVEPRVGTRWGAIVRKALARKPSERFASAAEFARCLSDELAVTGFDNPREEAARFLQNPKLYKQAFTRDILAALLRAAEHARRTGKLSEAASQFNRALAYSPGNHEVLSQISGLGRRRTLRQIAVAMLAGSVALALLITVLPFGASVEAPALQEPALPKPLPGSPSVPNEKPKQTVPEQSGQAPRPTVVAPDKHMIVRTKPVVNRELEPEAPAETREVKVFIAGALGGSLRIDGQPLEWFGKTHKLGIGQHRFEFVPPNRVCCEGSETVVEIEPGVGPQTVRGHIAFREARLQASSLNDERAVLTCPTILSEQLMIPGETTVQMAQAEVTARCTVMPEAPLSAPVQRVVTLRAGQTTALSWP